MIRTGTTTANDMLTTHNTERGIQAAIDIGIRARIGKMLMDTNNDSPDIIKEDSETKQEDDEQLDERLRTTGSVDAHRIQADLDQVGLVVKGDQVTGYISGRQFPGSVVRKRLRKAGWTQEGYHFIDPSKSWRITFDGMGGSTISQFNYEQ